jgi:WD40 repeat protein
VLGVALSNKMLITGSSDETARVWEKSSGKEIHKLNGHSGEVSAVAVALDSSFIVTGSSDSTTRLWDFKNKKPIRQLTGRRFFYSRLICVCNKLLKAYDVA